MSIVGPLRRYFVAGLLVWVPLGVTVLIVKYLVDVMDQSLLLLPPAFRPEQLLGFKIPGLGVVLTILVMLITGMVVANFLGRRLVAVWESLLARIPLVRSIYSSVKQLMETFVSSRGQSFRRVVLIEFPRREVWTLAFVTADSVQEINEKTGRDMVHLFVPTAPNPTSGYFLIVPREEVIALTLSVDEGLKMIISAGAVVPKKQKEALVQADR